MVDFMVEKLPEVGRQQQAWQYSRVAGSDFGGDEVEFQVEPDAGR